LPDPVAHVPIGRGSNSRPTGAHRARHTDQSSACRARIARVVCLALNPHARRANMPTVRLNYDGWLALPAGMRQKLGISTGDQLALELVDGSITVRPRRGDTVIDRQAAELPVTTVEPAAPSTPQPPPAAAAAPIVKRGPGRPRKNALPTIPPTLKARGARRKAAAAPV
jgi:Antidote-toxin recognition MazE, bacterial antitoxin